MREIFTVCSHCGVMFPKPYDRVPVCILCGRDAELPGYSLDTMENLPDCSPRKPYAPEVM